MELTFVALMRRCRFVVQGCRGNAVALQRLSALRRRQRQPGAVLPPFPVNLLSM